MFESFQISTTVISKENSLNETIFLEALNTLKLIHWRNTFGKAH